MNKYDEKMRSMSIERKMSFLVEEKSVVVSARSHMMGEWHNCLYISFLKSSFSDLKYPELVDGYWGYSKKFDYNNCSLAELDWHGGITFYEEIISVESGNHIVKAGCDFSHLGDDHYGEKDFTDEILVEYAQGLIDQFTKLVSSAR